MPVSTSSAVNNFYSDALGVLKDIADNKLSPFYSQIKRVPTPSKDFIVGAKIGGGGGFTFGTESNAMPTGGGTAIKQLANTMKQMYGTIVLTDFAIKMSKSRNSSFFDLLPTELESMTKDMEFGISRSTMGDGTGKLATTAIIAEGNKIIVNQHKTLCIGDTIDIYRGDTNAIVVTRRITDIVRNADGTGDLYFDGAAQAFAQTGYITLQGALNNELTGVGAIINADGATSLYGITRSGNSWIDCVSHTYADKVTDADLQLALDASDEYKSGKVDMFLMSTSAYMDYTGWLTTMSISPKELELKGGFKTVAFQWGQRTIAIVKEKFVPAGEIWGVNTNDWEENVGSDWDYMMEGDTPKMSLIPGTKTYAIQLAKYSNLTCKNPGGTIRLRKA